MGILNYFKLKQARAIAMENKKNNDMIRLVYVSVTPYKDVYNDEKKYGALYITSSAFKLPENMTMEQACKVVSYISEKVEKENNIEPASKESVGMTSFELENYGFIKNKKITPKYAHMIGTAPFAKNPDIDLKAVDGVVDLITYGGKSGCFEKSDLYPRYFEWFTPNVTKKEVDGIYNSLNIKLKPQKNNIK